MTARLRPPPRRCPEPVEGELTPTFKLAVQEVIQAKLAVHLAGCDACAAFNRKIDGQAMAGQDYVQRWKIVLAYVYTSHSVFHGLSAGLPWGPAHSAACIRHLVERGWRKDQLRDVARLLLDEENAQVSNCPPELSK